MKATRSATAAAAAAAAATIDDAYRIDAVHLDIKCR